MVGPARLLTRLRICSTFVPLRCASARCTERSDVMSLARPVSVMQTDGSALLWIGQSGRHYRLVPDSSDRFQLRDGVLHVLIRRETALWAGSAGDIVADPHSRSGFRRADGRHGCRLSAGTDAGRGEPPARRLGHRQGRACRSDAARRDRLRPASSGDGSLQRLIANALGTRCRPRGRAGSVRAGGRGFPFRTGAGRC